MDFIILVDQNTQKSISVECFTTDFSSGQLCERVSKGSLQREELRKDGRSGTYLELILPARHYSDPSVCLSVTNRYSIQKHLNGLSSILADLMLAYTGKQLGYLLEARVVSSGDLS